MPVRARGSDEVASVFRRWRRVVGGSGAAGPVFRGERHEGSGTAVAHRAFISRLQMRIRLACFAAIAVCFSSTVWIAAQRSEPIQPIKPATVANRAMVELGKKLFFDPRL